MNITQLAATYEPTQKGYLESYQMCGLLGVIFSALCTIWLVLVVCYFLQKNKHESRIRTVLFVYPIGLLVVALIHYLLNLDNRFVALLTGEPAMDAYIETNLYIVRSTSVMLFATGIIWLSSIALIFTTKSKVRDIV